MKTCSFIHLVAFFASSAVSIAQDYRIDWHTISGGGGTSSGGPYSLSGTVGQPDAGSLGGGNYVLEGGFWAIVAIQQPGAPTLHIERSALNVIISWDSSVSNFFLQESGTASPLSWGNSFTGSTNPIAIPALGASRFYRLIKP